MKKLLGVAVVAFFLMPATAMAATMTAQVTVNTDSNLGGTGCQLRDAISAVASDSTVFNCIPTATTDPTDTVTFAPSLNGATIGLAQGEIDFSSGDGLSVMGLGMGNLTVVADGGSRVFRTTGPSATLSGMTVTGGAPNAVASQVRGGCIRSDATSTILNSVRVTDCEAIENNSAAQNIFADGGGIGGSGSLTLNNSLVDNNTTRAINTSADTTIAHARGAIFSDGGTMTLNNSVVSGNPTDASDDGSGSSVAVGGIAAFSPLNMSRSTISGNTASAEESSGNATAAGALETTANTAIELSTLAGNTADTTGTAITIPAGGIYSSLGGNTLALRSSTVALNGPTSATGIDGVNLFADNGGTVTFSNTILADPRGGGDNCLNVGGATTMTSLGFNVDYSPNGPTCFTTPLATDLTSNPLLSTAGVQNNGGPTPTVALQPTSPAIDAGLNSAITMSPATQDQRGLTRPVDFSGLPNAAGGNGTDIGAFEVQQACAGQSTPTTACPSGGGGPSATPPPTGQRAAALKKCKKKHKKKARKKCKKRANLLPV